MTEERVRRWRPLLKSMSLRQRLQALCSLYEDKDAYVEVQCREGGPALIERNCPFLSVAVYMLPSAVFRLIRSSGCWAFA